MAGLEERELAIGANRAEKKVVVRLADTGPGLPEQVRARLFEPKRMAAISGRGWGDGRNGLFLHASAPARFGARVSLSECVAGALDLGQGG
jgi:C4-dicarboxylate-specific signal transduction histidine kinase